MSAQTLLGAYGTEGEPSRLPLDLELAEANLRSRGVNGLLSALLRLNFMYIKRMCCLELHSHLGISVNCLFTPHRPFFGLLILGYRCFTFCSIFPQRDKARLRHTEDGKSRELVLLPYSLGYRLRRLYTGMLHHPSSFL